MGGMLVVWMSCNNEKIDRRIFEKCQPSILYRYTFLAALLL